MISNPRQRKAVAILVALTLTWIGCDTSGPKADASLSSVVVVNQGNFSDGNGSVVTYDPATAEVSVMVADIGSIIQSAHAVDDRLYVMSNTSNRVDVFDLATGSQIGQLDGVMSPRYMARSGSHKAYITNLFRSDFLGGTVTIVELASNTISGTIEVGDNPEGLTIAKGNLFVANSAFGAGRTVTIVDTSTDAVVSTIDVCAGPRMLFTDLQDEVFVVCTGETLYDDNFNVMRTTSGSVVILDGTTGSEVTRFELDGQVRTTGPGQDAFFSSEAEMLFVVEDERSILRYDTAANRFVGRIGPVSGDPIGAVAYDQTNEQLYLGRAPGFTVNGSVTMHTLDGMQVGTFRAGVAPSHILFTREAGGEN